MAATTVARLEQLMLESLLVMQRRQWFHPLLQSILLIDIFTSNLMKVNYFINRAKTCSSAVDLVREGRAALHTSFAVYKFLICYGQLFSMVKLCSFYYGVLMSLLGYIFVDAVAVLTLGYTMTMGGPKNILKKKRPTSSLLGSQMLVSVIGVIIINFFILITVVLLVTNSKNYVPWPSDLTTSKYWWYMSDNCKFYMIFYTKDIYFNIINWFKGSQQRSILPFT
jgi:magnesium-transporting ATPase (P-type)